jgi:hypothetical protein
MSPDEVELAFREGLIGSRTLVLPPGTGHWAAYGEVCKRDKRDKRESSDPLLDSEPHARKTGAELGIPSVPPMATDVSGPVPVPVPVSADRPWEAPPARFDGAFGPGDHDAAEIRTRRLIFAGILACALAVGFFAATGTNGIRALAGTLGGHRGAAAAAAVPPPPPPPAAEPAPAPPPATSASALPNAEPPVAPSATAANPAEPLKKPAKKKRRKPVTP